MIYINRLIHFSALFIACAMLFAAPAVIAETQGAKTASADDTARFLAGLPVKPSSPLAAMTKAGSWTAHARSLDKAWRRLDGGQLSKIDAWSKTHLSQQRLLMLYMFSGPDFLYADAFYPKATTYVLSALEPVGAIPNVARLSRGARGAALQNLRAAMQEVLTYSFFITKQMKSELRRGGLQGTLPVLYVFLARAGKTIQTVELISLNPDGSVSPREGRAPKGSSEGVKIGFTDENPQPRTLYYFSTDLSNGGLAKSGFMKFCEGLGPADALVKSASYLLHSGNFTTARNFLLKQSAALIQDDSGIPLRYFKRDEWNLQPFGRYVGPISIFPGRYQRDMQKLFARGRAKRAEFGIGYRWRTHETNVLLATKRQAEADAGETASTSPEASKPPQSSSAPTP